MKNKKVFIISLAFLLFVVGAIVIYDYIGGTDSDDMPGDTSAANPAPDFTVIDGNGNEVKLSDMKEKPVVLNFWASWCGPCKNEMPDFDEVYSELGDKISFMMVNLTDGDRETVESASSYIDAQGYSFPVYYDTKGEGASAYSIYSIPCTYFIDADGNAVVYARGAIDGETLREGIDMICPENG